MNPGACIRDAFGQPAELLSIFENISAYSEHQQIFRKNLFSSDTASFLLLSFEARHPEELMRLFGGLYWECKK
ncbi:hypothetical protein [Microcoleus sp. B4-C1]|uniref:hypothetical protein n=1 Tax=Microcoleus sp. B4-C1 TaxID=2818660 RepID=UPI002FD6FBD1